MIIPDDVIAAAAQAWWWESEGMPWVHATEAMREPYLLKAQAALEAALPIVAAQAWDEGALTVMAKYDIGNLDALNPYRSRA